MLVRNITAGFKPLTQPIKLNNLTHMPIFLQGTEKAKTSKMHFITKHLKVLERKKVCVVEMVEMADQRKQIANTVGITLIIGRNY